MLTDPLHARCPCACSQSLWYSRHLSVIPTSFLRKRGGDVLNFKNYVSLIKSNKFFRNFWIGQFISYFGDMFYDITVTWVVYTNTGSAVQSSLVLIVSFLPETLLAPFVGSVVDAYDRRRIMIFADLFRGSIVAGLLRVC
ncbi:MFS transporter [Alicyclobacillus macrosporangiidus]|uniref:MFS transporter n=1 Tax=Alicyclobacillus macrosporangiidus TaxID=392015 RepID=UPI0009F806EE